jgi:hypothetical protein
VLSSQQLRLRAALLRSTAANARDPDVAAALRVKAEQLESRADFIQVADRVGEAVFGAP